MDAHTVREATAADYPAFVRFFAELAVDDPIPSEARWSNEMAPRALFLVDESAKPTAYAYVVPMGESVHVNHLVVAPEARRQGLGRTLMLEVARRARARGATTWSLNVKPENTAARRLYEGLGLSVVHASTAFALRWDSLGSLPREPGTFDVVPILPEHDPALEEAFRITPGRLAMLRASHGRILVRVVDPSGPADAPPLGFTVFDPSFPGAYPFRVVRPTLAAPLLDAVRPHARPEHDVVNLTAEDDPRLAAALAAAGARVRMEILFMRGPLPEG